MLVGYIRARTDVVTMWRLERVAGVMNKRTTRKVALSSVVRHLVIEGLAVVEERLNLPPFAKAYKRESEDRAS
jgi:hypothetical protein